MKKKLNKSNNSGKFGSYGGQFVPETLMLALEELSSYYEAIKNDPVFIQEFSDLLETFGGRPTPLYFAKNLTSQTGGAKIYLKREDLTHTGAHKLNNAIGQALLAKKLGKTRIIAETGAGQHGVATATVCAKLGLECVVYMGIDDVKRQSLNVFRMKLLGAIVISVESGSRTLKDAINEAIRDWVTNISNTHYLIGSAVGPHPYPIIVRDFQSIIGRESRKQILELENRLPDYVLACVGGGSNSIGMFYDFIPDSSVNLIGIEAGGDGLDGDRHSASLSKGRPGVLHGALSYLLQDSNGQIAETHSISAGLDYPGVGPEHSYLKDAKRATYLAVTDDQALKGFQILSEQEGIIPALEPAHAVYYAIELSKTLKSDEVIVVCLSGRGDKDIDIVANALDIKSDDKD